MNEPLIARASEGEVREFAARRWADTTGRRMYEALAMTAPSGVWAARDAGTVVALAFAHALEDELYVSDLFVEPSFRKTGIGAQLMAEIVRDSGDASVAALVGANDVDAVAFLARRGFALQAPVFQVSGAIPREDDLLRMAAGDYRFMTARVDPYRHRSALDALDRDVRGSARPADHDGFAELATGTLFSLDDECVGYAYAWPDGRIGPLASASNAYMRQLFAFALATLVRTYGASWCTALVPGNNTRVLRAALRAGLTLERIFLFASDGNAFDFTRYVGFHQLAL